jgi:small multidrug resistance pump
MKYLLTIIYLLFTTGGMFLLKAGGESLKLSITKGIEFKIGYITLLGFLCYIISFLLWQKLLVTYDLSYIVPLTTGVSQIIILMVGAIGFGEQINWFGIIGVLLIICGVALITVGRG